MKEIAAVVLISLAFCAASFGAQQPSPAAAKPTPPAAASAPAISDAAKAQYWKARAAVLAAQSQLQGAQTQLQNVLQGMQTVCGSDALIADPQGDPICTPNPPKPEPAVAAKSPQGIEPKTDAKPGPKSAPK